MNFNEIELRHLIDETHKTITAMGTTSGTLIDKFRQFTDRLVEHLRSRDKPFNCDLCLQWVDSLEHDPPSKMSTSYIEWIALRRFIILIEKQRSETLTHWTHYQSKTPIQPKSIVFQEVLEKYKIYLSGVLNENTIPRYVSEARFMLLYLEKQGISQISQVRNAEIVSYFASERFYNRKPKGIQTEVCSLKKFLVFLVEDGHTDQKYLHCAIPRLRLSTERIITTLTSQMERDIIADEPDSLVNLRDKAIAFLALHVGLRECDIRNLKFNDIDWEKGVITIRQQKTGVALQMPIDNKTQNAIIDYVLNERRDCKTAYIFITAVGPPQKIARKHYRIKYRAKNTESFEAIPHDGLHIFRRTYASRLLKCGTPLPMISEMLGHIDKNAVQCYLSTDETKMKRCALELSAIPYHGRAF
ncbi:tyrosine-type recombinase/integrase [Streptococcus massiliensis]|uniref:Integrase/recombinase, phage integrase family protein n=2 Tax=Streptococcus massiliensis TaxID=313439 RepID=A0A380L091_9STRE|nr:tyrosine-type recombinase/integrase [Streptococcus massiliensis]SUN76764.1 integrase/recombinase, phage integrase family protein [Streptococcus massiliensis]